VVSRVRPLLDGVQPVFADFSLTPPGDDHPGETEEPSEEGS